MTSTTGDSRPGAVGRWPDSGRPRRPNRHLRLATGPSGDADTDRRWIARRLALDVAGAEAATALATAGVPTILLKGPVTAARLYPGEFRPYLDIDLIVADTSFAAAARVLTGLGYRLGQRSPDADCYLRSADGCGIDLHRTLPGIGVGPATVWRILATHQSAFTLGDAPLSILDDAAFALHLALHATHSGALKPKAGRDLERAVRRLPLAAWSGAALVAIELDAVDALTAALRCGSPEARGLADQIGLPRRFPWTYQVSIRWPARGFRTIAALPAGGVTSALRRWLVPTVTERTERLALLDARDLLPGAHPALRHTALRLEQVGQVIIGVSIEAGRAALTTAGRLTGRVAAGFPPRRPGP